MKSKFIIEAKKRERKEKERWRQREERSNLCNHLSKIYFDDLKLKFSGSDWFYLFLIFW